MSELLNRINSVIGNTNTEPWQALLALHSSDPEAFYELACLQQFCDVPTSVEAIAKLARQVRIAVWQSYQFEPTADGARLVVYDGPIIPIPGEIALRVKEFLRVVSGKTTSDTPGKDFLGREVSDAELQFKIEPPSGREFPVTTPLDSAPRVLRVAEEDAQSLKTQPAYVTYGLLHCARRVVLAPTSVFCGLRRGQGGVQSINSGFAICGEPRLLYDNQGASSAAPAGFVYVVYCDAEGFVFDWDWVREGSSGHPRDTELRFGDPQRQERDLVLELPADLTPGQFDRTVATYSNRGDCIFCYFLEGVSFADRINSDLTVFRRFETEEITGFKVKNVRRILQKDKSILLTDAPDLSVAVESVLLASFRLQSPEEADTEFYTVLIRAFHGQSLGELPKVRVPTEYQTANM